MAVVGFVTRTAAILYKIDNVNRLCGNEDSEREPEDEPDKDVNLLPTSSNRWRGPVKVARALLGGCRSNAQEWGQ